MNRYPWRNTSEDIAEQTPSQWETPAGAQAKADAAEAAAKEYSDERLAEHVGTGGDAHALAVPDGEAGFISGADQAKLNGIEEHAEVNQNAFTTVNGIAATTKEDQITIEAGTGIIVTPVANEKKVRITAGGTAIPAPHGPEHVGDGADPIPDATETVSGLMSPTDKVALNTAIADIEALSESIQGLAGVGRTTETVKGNADAITDLTAQLAEKANKRWFDVKDYGAVGDGITDDTTAIQTVLDLAKSHPIQVLIPEGQYKLTATLRIYNNTKVLMHGAVLLRCHSDYFMLTNGDYGATYNDYNGHGNIIIEGGTFEGNVIAYPDFPNVNAIGLARGKNIIIRDVEIRDVAGYHAIDMNACENVLIENCRFLGYKNTEGTNYKEAIQIAEHVQSGFNQFGAYDGTPSRNITVKNCYFGASGTTGTQAWPTGVGHHHAMPDKFTSNIKIIGNTFDGLTYCGVQLFKYVDTYVANNTFLDCLIGVRLSNPNGTGADDGGVPQSGRNHIVSGNIFKNTTRENIYAAGWERNGTLAWLDNVIITNNIFENQNGQNGNDVYANIYFHFVRNAIITDNIFKTAYRGMHFEYARDVYVSRNEFYDIIGEAFYSNEPDTGYQGLDYTANINITHNTIKNTGRTALLVQYANGFDISWNRIENACNSTDGTRPAINCAFLKNGKVTNNTVIKAVTGNQNSYGLTVASTTTNCQTFNNYLEGKTGKLNMSGSSNWEGFYIIGPGGVGYKVTINSSGVLTTTVD